MSWMLQQVGPDEYQVLQEQQQAQGLLFQEDELPVPTSTIKPTIPVKYFYTNEDEQERGFAGSE